MLKVRPECFAGILSLSQRLLLEATLELALSTEEAILRHDVVSLPKDQYCSNNY